MTNYDQSINQQYSQTDLSAKILAALQSAGKDINALTEQDVASLDEFHPGGVVETRNLAQLAGLKAGMEVLDVGSGLGGPARRLAAEFGCRVTGIDMTEEYVRAANMLTERVGMADQVKFEQGNATELPFPDNSFDVVWTQFTGMNIADKGRLYDQFRRVLKNGGLLAIHEAMTAQEGAIHYPVFWADDSSIDFRQTPDQCRQLLTARGFNPVAWKERDQFTIEFFQKLIAGLQQSQPPLLGVFLFVDQVSEKAANLMLNLQEKRVTAIQAVFQLAK